MTSSESTGASAFLLTGASNESISEQLYLTGNTVKTHIRSILAKLGVPDRVHVVIWGFETGIAGRERRRQRDPGARE